MRYNINSSCCTPLAISSVVFDLDYMDFAARPPPAFKKHLALPAGIRAFPSQRQRYTLSYI